MDVDPDAMNVFFLPGSPPISNDEIRKRIDAETAQHGPLGLAIVDTSAAYFQGDDENSNAQLGAHARMLRSFTNLPGGPSIIVTCHPTKTPNMDNLQPRGGGSFIAEMDGNFVCIKDEPIVNLHWHGKFRGAGLRSHLVQAESRNFGKIEGREGKADMDGDRRADIRRG
jgi:hypothetical protein